MAAASFFMGPETNYAELLIASFSIGFGAGFYETLLNAVIVEQNGLEAPRRLLFIHSAATLGASVTPFVIGFLSEPLDLHWYDSFRAAGVIHLVLALGFPLLPASRRMQSHAESESSLSEPLLGRPALLATICVVTFAYVGVESAMTFFVADYAQSELGLTEGRSTSIVGFFWMGLLAGRLTAGLRASAPSPQSLSLLAAMSSAVAASLFLAGVLPAELAMILTGFLLGGVFPIMIGLAGMTLPGATGTAVGFAAGVGSIGGFVIPWLTGVLATRASLGAALATLSLWLLILAAASWGVHRLHAR